MKKATEQCKSDRDLPRTGAPDRNDNLVELYTAFVASAEDMSERRQAANQYFLALNTAAIGFVSVFAASSTVLIFAVNLSCVVICLLWFLLICSYKQLNAAKFGVIHEIESRLDFAPFRREWELLGAGREHYHFSTIERAVPIIFCVLHVLFMAFLVFER